MSLYLIHLGMTVSVICFGIGYYFRVRNNVIHVVSNIFGMGFNLMTAVYLLTMKYGLGGLDLFGIQPAVDMWIIHVHRLLAVTALFMMLAMGYTGITRNKNVHVKLHYVFVPLYLVVYVSGLFIFEYVGE
ncbi:MAG: hypothetical protein JJT78_18600 [Leptospira sp.]|nr:hypothetical protein [Leptospira sp.]